MPAAAGRRKPIPRQPPPTLGARNHGGSGNSNSADPSCEGSGAKTVAPLCFLRGLPPSRERRRRGDKGALWPMALRLCGGGGWRWDRYQRGSLVPDLERGSASPPRKSLR
ncbi:unnamed protein product [Lampetra fluviatilis]